jgi:hypothetical protein
MNYPMVLQVAAVAVSVTAGEQSNIPSKLWNIVELVELIELIVELTVKQRTKQRRVSSGRCG